MANIVVVGGGMAGQTAAMLLAKDGNLVTVLERDPEAPPASVDEAWARWERRGVNQFRMLHYFLPRFRDVLERYVEVPDVEVALAQAERLGGTRLMGPQWVMESVEIGMFADPEGHPFGVIKAVS